MTDFSISGETIFPSVNDIAAVAGNGKVLRELELSRWRRTGGYQNHRVSGLTISSATTTGFTVSSGEAWIEGYYLQIPASTAAIANTSTGTQRVWLKLSRDGSNKVNGGVYQVSTATAAPSESVQIGSFQTSDRSVAAPVAEGRKGFNFRLVPRVQVFTGSGTFTPPADVTEVYVEVSGGGGGGGGGFEGPNLGGVFGHIGMNGGHGGVAFGVVRVNPGTGVSISVGAAGTAGAAAGAGGAGGNSSFAAPDGTVSASGGAGGPLRGDGVAGAGHSGGSGGDGVLTGGGGPGGNGGSGGLFGGGGGGVGMAGAAGRVVVYY